MCCQVWELTLGIGGISVREKSKNSRIHCLWCHPCRFACCRCMRTHGRRAGKAIQPNSGLIFFLSVRSRHEESLSKDLLRMHVVLVPMMLGDPYSSSIAFFVAQHLEDSRAQSCAQAMAARSLRPTPSQPEDLQ